MTEMRDWTKEEVDFVKENHINMSVNEIALRLGRTHSSVENKKGKLGLKGERKYNFNMEFFESPLNEISSYWLGFIGADGYISSHKEFSIQLKSTDYEHLKKFNKSMGGNIPVTFFEKKPGMIDGKPIPACKICQIRIYSTKMVSDLINLGILPNKSLIFKFPNLDNEALMWSFIRGYFDGDGSVYYDERSNQLRTKITSGSKVFREGFSDFLKPYGIKTYMTAKGDGLDCGITGKESTRIFLSKMYDNSNMHLDRKYNKYQNYKYLFGLSE